MKRRSVLASATPAPSGKDLDRLQFTVVHYAGKVTYDTQLFLDKNRDYLIPEQFIILGDSEEELVKSIFAEASAEFKASGGSMEASHAGGGRGACRRPRLEQPVPGARTT